VDRTRQSSVEELKQHNLEIIREAVAILEAKAAAEELEDYRNFVAALAERVAGAKDEGDGGPVSDAERAAIDEVKAALGSGGPGAPVG
jgi:hypothetical protein